MKRRMSDHDGISARQTTGRRCDASQQGSILLILPYTRLDGYEEDFKTEVGGRSDPEWFRTAHQSIFYDAVGEVFSCVDDCRLRDY